MADLNIVGVTTINGRTTATCLNNGGLSAVVTNTYGNSKTFKINNVILSSNSISLTPATANVMFYDYSQSNAQFPIVSRLDIASNGAIDILSKPLYLEEGDRLTANTSSNNTVTIIVSYEELA